MNKDENPHGYLFPCEYDLLQLPKILKLFSIKPKLVWIQIKNYWTCYPTMCISSSSLKDKYHACGPIMLSLSFISIFKSIPGLTCNFNCDCELAWYIWRYVGIGFILVVGSKEEVAFSDAFVSHIMAANPVVHINQWFKMPFLENVSNYSNLNITGKLLQITHITCFT